MKLECETLDCLQLCVALGEFVLTLMSLLT